MNVSQRQSALLIFLTYLGFVLISFFLYYKFQLDILSTLIASSPIAAVFAYCFSKILNKPESISQISALGDLSNEFLVQLARKAPGTYNHSLMVAEIAASAASSLSLDGKLLRIAGYYHDIGKLKTPREFLENISKDQITQSIDIRKKARAIIDHVTYGIELARENNFPDEIVDFIAQHHGTTSISSLKNNLNKLGEPVEYPGPKPLTKESAILMLADSIEARVKSLNSKQTDDITKAIEYEFKEKISDNQLEMVNFSLNDILKLKKSFLRSLEAIYHNRKLPKLIKDDKPSIY